MELQRIIEARQEQANRLTRLIEQAGAAFKELGNSTLLLNQELHRADKRRQNGARLASDPVHGLGNMEARVRGFVEWAFHGTGNGRTIDLAATVRNENASAAKFVADMAEVKK